MPASPTASPATARNLLVLRTRFHAPRRGGECPEIFLTPPPPTVLHRTRRMARRMRGSERSEDPAHLPTDRGGAPSCRPLIATCSQCSERGANHQGIAHPDTPQTPLKRAPFWGVPKSVPKRGGKKVSKKVSRMGELLNTPFFVHFFAPRDPIFGPPGGDPPFWGPSSKDKSGSGPQKGGFWGSENPPRRPPGAPGPAPGISPPGPARAPGRPPRDPPSGTPPGTPP